MWVPDFDRGLFDPNNVICVVLEEKNTLFKLGCAEGVFDRYYAFNSFFKSNLACSFNVKDIPKVKDKKYVVTDEMVVMSLREAVRKMSVGTGKGFVKCSCDITNVPILDVVAKTLKFDRVLSVTANLLMLNVQIQILI